MSRRHPIQAEDFGTILGYAPGNVPVYSSYYESLDSEAMPDRSQFKSYLDDIYMGYKWQCVEFARRWLYVNKAYVFSDVAMAYDIFELQNVIKLKEDKPLPLKSFRNGSKRAPEPGSLLIWNEGGEFVSTGHVAIITEVLDLRIRIAEQNLEHTSWAADRDWSRELSLEITSDGEHKITCTYDDTSILGWVIQTEESEYAEVFEGISPDSLRLKSFLIDPKPGDWLDTRHPAQAAYVKFMDGHRMTCQDKDLGRYFTMTKEARKELKHASNQLHDMFIKATDYVLENESVLKYFNLPLQLIPRIKQSWRNRKTHNIMARFDFSMSERGLKVYEYNADSAGCFFECGLVQRLWSIHNGVFEGRDAGLDLFDDLVESWENCDINETIHILKDDNLEETYMAEYMKSSIEAARIKSKIISSFNELSWNSEGSVVDKDGEVIKWVWKSWAWETAINELRRELNDDENYLSNESASEKQHVPRLVDVLLHADVMVFEPLWSLITSNKALLPVLWKLYPNHPNLLECHFELTDSLIAKGYVSKPIVGRCGDNITIYAEDKTVLEKTSGQFEDKDNIYQEFWALPKIDTYYTQISSFTVDGIDSAACVRCSESMILDSDSDLFALRIV